MENILTGEALNDYISWIRSITIDSSMAMFNENFEPKDEYEDMITNTLFYSLILLFFESKSIHIEVGVFPQEDKPYNCSVFSSSYAWDSDNFFATRLESTKEAISKVNEKYTTIKNAIEEDCIEKSISRAYNKLYEKGLTPTCLYLTKEDRIRLNKVFFGSSESNVVEYGNLKVYDTDKESYMLGDGYLAQPNKVSIKTLNFLN